MSAASDLIPGRLGDGSASRTPLGILRRLERAIAMALPAG